MKRKEREELPHDVVEEILERLEVKSLVRLRCVSKQWNFTIKSTSFASRHLIKAQSRDPHVVFSVGGNSKPISYLCSWDIKSPDPFQRFHKFPKSNSDLYIITGSCDGLVCVYDFQRYVYVINPATRWSRSLPCAKIQEINQVRPSLDGNYYKSNYLGFGKDTMTGKYKMVWLYNSIKPNLDQVGLLSTCEVFDFNTNTWRYVMSSIHSTREPPLYLDGSLYWLTLRELKLIRFDLHTEVFQEMEQVLPLVDYDTSTTVLCCLNNRLCISEKKGDIKNQEIWSLNSDKVWEKTYTINIYGHHRSVLNPSIRWSLLYPLTPITVFNKTEMLLLLNEYTESPFFVIHDNRTGSSSLILDSVLLQASSYFPTLISI